MRRASLRSHSASRRARSALLRFACLHEQHCRLLEHVEGDVGLFMIGHRSLSQAGEDCQGAQGRLRRGAREHVRALTCDRRRSTGAGGKQLGFEAERILPAPAGPLTCGEKRPADGLAFENGVLTVSVPKAEQQERSRRIQIGGSRSGESGGRTQIAGESGSSGAKASSRKGL
jgi:hypothetical protein